MIDCGCVWDDNRDTPSLKPEITYCPMHEAAPDMYKALKWALPLLLVNAPAPFETEAARLIFAKQLIAAQHVVCKAEG